MPIEKTEKYATKKELQQHKKEVEKMIKAVTKGIKKWDIKQDAQEMKKVLKKKKFS
jgi:hypothetical protein